MSRQITKKKRITAIIVASVLLLGGGGAAFAYWTSTGSGAGSATTGTDTPFTISSTTAGAPLTPGGATDTITYQVTNTGTGTQNFTTLTAAVATSTGGVWTFGGPPACTAADYTLGNPSVTSGSLAPGASVTGTVTIQMVNSATNQNACKNATVPVYFAAN